MKILPIMFSIPAAGIFTLSASANGYTGYDVGSMIGGFGGLFGMSFMLVTELFTPMMLLLDHKVKPNYTLFQRVLIPIGVVMGLSLSVGSFWNSVNTGLTKSYAELAKTKDTKKEVALKSGKIDIDDRSNEVGEASLTQPHIDAIYRLKNTPAKNYAGNDVYKNGKKLTLWEATNSCTSGVYFTKIYPSQCAQIARHESEIRTIKADNEKRVKSLQKASDNAGKKVELQQDLTELNYKENTMSPMIVMLSDYVGDDASEVRSQISKVSLFIAIFSEVIKLSLIAAFIITLEGKQKERRKPVISTIIKEWRTRSTRIAAVSAVAKGKREAELDFENKRVAAKVIIFDATEYMSKVKYTDIEGLYDFDAEFNTRNTDINENKMLLVLVSREYCAGGQMVLKKTLNDICERVADAKSEYVKQIINEFGVSHSELVNFTCEILKVHRLRNIIFPALVRAGLAETAEDNRGSTIYRWKSEKDIEYIFKKLLQ